MHDEEQLTDVVEIISKNDFVRPIYAGNLYLEFRRHKKEVLTVRGNKFRPTEKSNQNLESEEIVFKEFDTKTKLIKQQ